MHRWIFLLFFLLSADIAVGQAEWPAGSSGSGSGDVSGPGSSTDNALPRFDGTGGDTLQDSGVIVDDSDNVSGIGTLDVDGVADFSTATSHMLLPGGTTAQRSGTTDGQFRFNSTTGNIEYYSSGWVTVGSSSYSADGNGIEEAATVFSLELDGSTLSKSASGLKVGTITATELGTDSVDSDEIAADAVGSSEIATSAVQSAEIDNGTIVNEDVNASANIDASKLGDGSVSNTEFGLLDGLTGTVLDSSNTVNVSGKTFTDAVNFSSTSHISLPSGTTAQRPGTPAEGDCRYNSTETAVECYQAAGWVELGSGAGAAQQIDFETKTAAGENGSDATTVISFTNVPTDKLVWVRWSATYTVEVDNDYVYLAVESNSTEIDRCGVTDDDAGVTTGDSEENYTCMTRPFIPGASTVNIVSYVDGGHADDVEATIYVDNDSMYNETTDY